MSRDQIEALTFGLTLLISGLLTAWICYDVAETRRPLWASALLGFCAGVVIPVIAVFGAILLVGPR